MAEESYEDCVNATNSDSDDETYDLSQKITIQDYKTKNLSTKAVKEYKYKSLRGKTINTSKSKKFITKQINIRNLLECFELGDIHIPSIQRTIDETKIENMLKTYREDNESFNFLTNPIQLIYMSDYDKYLLIDGQHRFYMYRKLFESLLIDNEYEITVNIIKTNDKETIYGIYKRFNYDISDRLKTIDEFDIEFEKIFKDLNYTQFNIFCCKIMKYFATKTNPYIYTFEEFINILYDGGYVEKFDTVKDSYDYLKDTNKKFFEKIYTEKNKKSMILNKEEVNTINQKVIFNLKQNNYIELLIDYDISNDAFKGKHIWIIDNIEHSVSILCKI